MKRQRISVDLPPALVKKLDRLARLVHRSRSDVVRKIIYTYRESLPGIQGALAEYEAELYPEHVKRIPRKASQRSRR